MQTPQPSGAQLGPSASSSSETLLARWSWPRKGWAGCLSRILEWHTSWRTFAARPSFAASCTVVPSLVVVITLATMLSCLTATQVSC